MMYPLLAQSTFENIFKLFKIDPIRELWTIQWNLALGGGVYAALANVGRGLALVSLFISLIQFFRDASEESRSIDGRNRSVTEFIWPIIVVFLLSNNALFLKNSTLAIRNAFNNLNDIVLATDFGGADLATQFQRATQEGAAKEQIGGVLTRCVTAEAGKQQQCLKEADTLIDKIADRTQKQLGSTDLSSDFTNYVDKVKQALTEASQPDENGVRDTSVLGAFTTDVEQAKARREQLTSQLGFQTLIELTFLLTGLLAPLAVGLSILPIRAKPLYAWFAAFASIGLTKVVFNFSLGVTASLLFTAKFVDTLLLTNLSGTLLPVGSAGLFLVLTTALYRVIDSVKVQT